MRSVSRQFLAHRSLLLLMLLGITAPMGSMSAAKGEEPWLHLSAQRAKTERARRIVLIAGDEEYRSEEGLPQLAKILAVRHGFDCFVLFPINPQDGTIDPNRRDNIPGLDALDSADLMVLLTRFRDLPDDQMQHIAAYVDSGRPIVGLRTATHAFAPNPHSKFAKYGWQSKEWESGFGRQVLGETWINHHGHHGKQSTRGIIAPGMAEHPILRGIHDGDIWGPTDVYAVRLPLPSSCKPLVMGEVLSGMHPNDPPVSGKQNDPMMPIAWTNAFHSASGNTARVFATTMGASEDLQSEGLRRLIVNACYWAMGLEEKIPAKSDVDLVGPYHPTRFGFGAFTKGVRPSDLKAGAFGQAR